MMVGRNGEDRCPSRTAGVSFRIRTCRRNPHRWRSTRPFRRMARLSEGRCLLKSRLRPRLSTASHGRRTAGTARFRDPTFFGGARIGRRRTDTRIHRLAWNAPRICVIVASIIERCHRPTVSSCCSSRRTAGENPHPMTLCPFRARSWNPNFRSPAFSVR